MLPEEVKHIKKTKIGLVKALCSFEGRSHTPDEYMEDLKSAADAASIVRNDIVEMAARDGGGNLVATETKAKAADAAVIASGHLRLFLSVNEVQWLLLEKDGVVKLLKQTVSKVLEEVKAMSTASGVAVERLGLFFDETNEEDVESTSGVMIKVDQVQKKKQ